MFKFEKEYTREVYDKAVEDAEIYGNAYRYKGTILDEEAPKVEQKQAIYDELASDADKANMKVEKLYGKAWKEAHKLNKKYDKLNAKAEKAADDLINFERESLGMKEMG